MTKDVLVSVSGMQFGNIPDSDKIEIITSGNYYKKNNKHYVLYDEVFENPNGIIKNVAKFDDNSFNLIKSGMTNVNMVFEENKKNMTNYITPYGTLMVGIDANKVDIQETEDNIDINIDYALEINYEHYADCKIKMNITAKGSEGFHL